MGKLSKKIAVYLKDSDKNQTANLISRAVTIHFNEKYARGQFPSRELKASIDEIAKTKDFEALKSFKRLRTYANDYILAVGEEHSSDFDIHHIDHDRGNSEIHNLVAVPKKWHVEYHRLYNEIERFTKMFLKDPQEKYKAHLNFMQSMYMKSCAELKVFIKRRDELLKRKNESTISVP